MRREECHCPAAVKPFLLWGLSHCGPFSAPAVYFINTKADETALVLMNNPPCYLTEQINIPEV